MWQVCVSALLFLFVPIKASNKTDDVQTEILRGEKAFKAVLNRTVQWDIEYALQQMRVAQTSALNVDRVSETRTLSALLQAQLTEIKRLVSVLRGLHAETCTFSTTAQVNRIVSNSVTLYDGCVQKYLPDVTKTVYNLTIIEYAYRNIQGNTAIRQCALHGNISAVRSCVDKSVADLANFSSTVEQNLRSTEGRIAEALKIFPTCIEESRSNATTAINSLIKSIQVCAEGSGVILTIREFPNRTNSLNASVDLVISTFNTDKEQMYRIQSFLATMVDTVKQLDQQIKQITTTEIVEAVRSLFTAEARIITNATLTKNLSPKQFVCIKYATYNYNTAIRRAVKAWVECANNLSGQIFRHLLSLEELNRNLYKTIEGDGFTAYMKCVTQLSANSTAANECISRHSDRLLMLLNLITEQADTKYQAGIELADTLDQCVPASQNKTKTEMAKIVNNLKSCVPQLNIPSDSS